MVLGPLSVSKINLFLRCAKQFEFKYVKKIPYPTSPILYQGRIFHSAIEHNYTQKIKSHEDLPVNDVVEAFADFYDKELLNEDVTFESKVEKGKVKDQGVLATETHHVAISPSVQPVEVECRIETKIDKVDVVGILDVIDDKDIIRDNKLAGKRKSQSDLDKDLQMSMYSKMYRNKTGKKEKGLQLDITLKGRKETQILKTKRKKQDFNILSQVIEGVMGGIKSGNFPPNPNGWHCSPKYCNFWSLCIGKKGGSQNGK